MLDKLQNVLKYNILIVSLLFFSACGSTPSSPKKVVSPPAWVYAILPDDTPTKMYGLGIGKNREDAIKVALNDMVSRLSVTLKSSFQSKEKVTNYSHSSVFTSDIKSSVSDIKISNYKVIKSYRISYKEFAVMVESDKSKFIAGLKAKLKSDKESIKERFFSVASRDALTRYNVKKSLAKEAKKLATTVSIISLLDKNFNKATNDKFIREMEKSYLSEANKLKFYIKSDSIAKPFAKRIANFLAQKHFNIVSSNSGAIVLSVKVKRDLHQGDIEIVIFTIDMSVFDGITRIGGNSIIVKERYNGSMASAYKSATIHFEQDINTQGIKSLLGIDLDVE